MLVNTLILIAAVVCASSSLLEAQDEIVLPKRRAAEHVAAVLPSLPPDAEQIKPTTMDVLSHGERRTVLRSVNRILVTTKEREWLFERNAIDPRRVAATVVEHTKSAVVVYSESDVRNLLGLNGWAEVLALTSETSQSPALIVQRVRPGVDERLLQPCQTRFPTYKVIEIADWLESK